MKPHELIGKQFFLTTHADSGPETEHKVTVIDVNVAGKDSLLLELDPPLTEGMYLEPEMKGEWRKGIKQFGKVVILRRHAGQALVPPGPSFPIVVHIYGWPEAPVARKIDWGYPDDWGVLHFSAETRNQTVKGHPLPPWAAVTDTLSCLLWPVTLPLTLIWYLLRGGPKDPDDR